VRGLLVLLRDDPWHGRVQLAQDKVGALLHVGMVRWDHDVVGTEEAINFVGVV